VKYLRQYRIPFSGLASGKHDFEYDIDGRFFGCYAYSLVREGALLAKVALRKEENMLVVHFDVSGSIRLTCDTCLSEFDAPMAFSERILVKFAEEDWEADTEEIIVLPLHAHELDIAGLLYEFVNVRVPYYPKCSEQGVGIACDPEILAHLGTAGATEKQEDQEEETDPRWEALQKLKNKN